MWQIHSAVPLRPPVLSGSISFAGVDLGCPLLLKSSCSGIWIFSILYFCSLSLVNGLPTIDILLFDVPSPFSRKVVSCVTLH